MIFNLVISLLFYFSALFTADEPQFKGGVKSLNSFITNAIIYPQYAQQNCLEGTIYVSFKLNKQGRIFHSEVQKGLGVDLDDEALRVVRLTSGKWIVPAKHDTLVALVLPVNFALKDFKCEQRTKDEIKAAIEAYKAREALTHAIYNFYDKKSAGKYDPKDEVHILDLKSQLGYDDKFIDRLLKQAQRKLKQGDREGACEDFITVRRLGSNKADHWIKQHCNQKAASQ